MKFQSRCRLIGTEAKPLASLDVPTITCNLPDCDPGYRCHERVAIGAYMSHSVGCNTTE
jgi:hypothetical protein